MFDPMIQIVNPMGISYAYLLWAFNYFYEILLGALIVALWPSAPPVYLTWVPCEVASG